MVLAILRCSMDGKWTGGAVGAETGKLIKDDNGFGRIFVSEAPSASFTRHPARRALCQTAPPSRGIRHAGALRYNRAGSITDHEAIHKRYDATGIFEVSDSTID